MLIHFLCEMAIRSFSQIEDVTLLNPYSAAPSYISFYEINNGFCSLISHSALLLDILPM